LGETKKLMKKTLLSLTLVRLCKVHWACHVVIFAIAQLSCF